MFPKIFCDNNYDQLMYVSDHFKFVLLEVVVSENTAEYIFVGINYEGVNRQSLTPYIISSVRRYLLVGFHQTCRRVT